MTKAAALFMGVILAIAFMIIGCMAAYLMSYIFTAWMSAAAGQIAVLVTLIVFAFLAVRGLLVTR